MFPGCCSNFLGLSSAVPNFSQDCLIVRNIPLYISYEFLSFPILAWPGKAESWLPQGTWSQGAPRASWLHHNNCSSRKCRLFDYWLRFFQFYTMVFIVFSFDLSYCAFFHFFLLLCSFSVLFIGFPFWCFLSVVFLTGVY